MSRAFARFVTASSLLMLAVVVAPAAASSPDAVFVTKAADLGATVVRIAQTGADRAAKPAVKACAKQTALDHRTLNRELTELAKSKDVTIPPPPETTTADVEATSGPAFDQALLARLTETHDAAIALFESEARDGRDADVKEWAARQLPALREHLATIRALAGAS